MMRWFKHITSTRMDEKISALYNEKGLAGYGFWWIMLETVAHHITKDSIKAEATYPLKQWPHLTHTHHHTFRLLLDALASNSLVSLKYEGSNLTVEISNLLKYRDEYTSRSGRKSGVTPDQETDTEPKTDTELKNKENAPIGGNASLEFFVSFYKDLDRVFARSSGQSWIPTAPREKDMQLGMIKTASKKYSFADLGVLKTWYLEPETRTKTLAWWKKTAPSLPHFISILKKVEEFLTFECNKEEK